MVTDCRRQDGTLKKSRAEQLFDVALEKVHQFLGEDYDDAPYVAAMLLYGMGSRVTQADAEDVQWAEDQVIRWSNSTGYVPFDPDDPMDWAAIEMEIELGA